MRCREQTLGASIGTTIWLLIWLATVLSGSVRILDKDLVSDHVKPRPKSKQTSLTFHHASSFSTWVTREMLFMQYFPSAGTSHVDSGLNCHASHAKARRVTHESFGSQALASSLAKLLFAIDITPNAIWLLDRWECRICCWIGN